MKKDKEARHVMSDMITQKSRTIVLVYKLKKTKPNQKMFHLNPRNWDTISASYYMELLLGN